MMIWFVAAAVVLIVELFIGTVYLLVVSVALVLLRIVGDVHRNQVVGHEARELVKPERRDAGEDLTLVRDFVWEDEVKRADAIACHHEQAVTAIVDVANLAVRIRAKLHGSH